MESMTRLIWDCCRSSTTIADGVKALALADAATRSWRERRVIEL
jgi:hypothetical protein